MTGRQDSEDYYPLTWVGRFPVYLTTMLVAVHVVTMIGVTIALAVGGGGSPGGSPLLAPLIFSGQQVLGSFTIWQFVTYAFLNVPSLWFVVEMYLLFSFGSEVEKFLGRKAFIWLYVALVLAIPTLLTALTVAGMPTDYWGSSAIHFAMFIAFVVIYPNAEIFFGIQAKWIALILVGINSLQSLAFSQWIPLSLLWVECGVAYGMLRVRGVQGFELPAIRIDPDRKRRTFPLRKERAVAAKVEPDPFESIDPLLEKISRQGIGSLTKRERDRLEKARADLIDRERGSR